MRYVIHSIIRVDNSRQNKKSFLSIRDKKNQFHSLDFVVYAFGNTRNWVSEVFWRINIPRGCGVAINTLSHKPKWHPSTRDTDFLCLFHYYKLQNIYKHYCLVFFFVSLKRYDVLRGVDIKNKCYTCLCLCTDDQSKNP